MEMQQLIERSHLDPRIVNAWVEAEWLLPATARTGFDFSEADLARALLIQDLKVDFRVNDEGIAIVLHLLDQLHGLRSLLKDIRTMEPSVFGTDDSRPSSGPIKA
ncbi:chaperone modulator CbpM [Bradyrhizobium genosp. P]|uniref:chaperone modulator CbpM n=1 Tax=Bradyrhizobium genosp. P TaxID=83641 RepID=UPI003CF40193